MRRKISLNGYWDFKPIYGCFKKTRRDRAFYMEPGDVPHNFITGKYLVPSVFRSTMDLDGERTFDVYGYPKKWNTTKTAWFKKVFSLPEDIDIKNNDVFLNFNGVLGKSIYWFNSVKIAENQDSSMPVRVNITDLLRFGAENEIIVYVTDYEKVSDDLTLYPSGGFFNYYAAGIWQDVEIDILPKIRVDDWSISTSVREGKVTFSLEVLNNMPADFIGEIRVTAADNEEQAFSLAEEISIPGQSSHIAELTGSLEGIRLWSSENPYLYKISIELFCGDIQKGDKVDGINDRIGFREFRIDGCNFRLNEKIIHLAGDWGHRGHVYMQSPEYLSCWFGMMKDLGMNYVRFHTAPYDPVVYRVAEEMGILVCAESAIFASLGVLAPEYDEFWVNSREHIKRFVRRDKNYSSIILWSVSNEMRHFPREVLGKITIQLPRLREIIKEIDPTRPVYYDGDTGLWDESVQEVISRHYGGVITGEGWWDKTRPLLSSEMGKWHYAQSTENVMLGGNEVYHSLYNCHKAVAIEAAGLIERARINGVSCIFPWNISCLDNLKVPDKDINFSGEGIKCGNSILKRIPAYSSEFRWWDKKKNTSYKMGPSFEIIKEAFKKERAFIWEKQCEYYVNKAINRTVSLINDSEQSNEYIIKTEAYYENTCEKVYSDTRIVILTPGEILNTKFELLPQLPGRINIKVDVYKNEILIDGRNQLINVQQLERLVFQFSKKVLVIGDGSLEQYLENSGLDYKRIIEPDDIEEYHGLEENILLIFERNTLPGDAEFLKKLQAFAAEGGRILIMEQPFSPLKDIELNELNLVKVHASCNDFEGIDFSWWGEKALPGFICEDFVAKNALTRPDKGRFKSLVNGGTGDFGKGGFKWSVLLEVYHGKGLMTFIQLELTKFWDKTPSALKALNRIIDRCMQYKISRNSYIEVDTESTGLKMLDKLICVESKRSFPDINREYAKKGDNYHIFLDGRKSYIHDATYVDSAVQRGAKAWIFGINPDTLEFYRNLIKKNIELVSANIEYQGVLCSYSPYLEGVTNEQLSWHNKINYSPSGQVNHVITTGYAIKTQREDNNSLISVTPDESYRIHCDVYKYNELYRAKVLAMLEGQNRTDSLMYEVLCGNGSYIICQIKLLFKSEPKSYQLWAQILSNLGISKDKKWIADSVNSALMPNYPGSIRILKDYDAEIVNKILLYKFKGDICFAAPEMNERSWEVLNGNKGIYTLPEGNILVLSYVFTPVERKLIQTYGGLPNPRFTTSLALKGEGEFIVYVNGFKAGEVFLEGDVKNIPEISLEKGWNRVMILCKTRQLKSDNFNMYWYSSSLKPESNFSFM